MIRGARPRRKKKEEPEGLERREWNKVKEKRRGREGKGRLRGETGRSPGQWRPNLP